MAERSFAEEVGKLRPGRGRDLSRRGHPRRHQGAARVRRLVRRRLSGRADLAPDGRPRRRRGHPGRARHPLRERAPARRPRRRRWRASVNYPLRGAVTFKGPVGVNVASDALANLASGGVTGGALVIVGEDYGEGSSGHAGAQPRVRDEVGRSGCSTRARTCRRSSAAVKAGFELSEASRDAGDDRAAHPRLPRPRPVHRVGEPASAVHFAARRWPRRRATSTASRCRR